MKSYIGPIINPISATGVPKIGFEIIIDPYIYFSFQLLFTKSLRKRLTYGPPNE